MACSRYGVVNYARLLCSFRSMLLEEKISFAYLLEEKMSKRAFDSVPYTYYKFDAYYKKVFKKRRKVD